MSEIDGSFKLALRAMTVRTISGADDIADLRRLSAGATLETWSFDAHANGAPIHPLILRRSPGGVRFSDSMPLETEAKLIQSLHERGVPVPTVIHTLIPQDELGDGFLMTRVEGETIPRKILRDTRFASIRPRLTAQFGAILGALARVDTARLPQLPVKSASYILERLTRRYETQGIPRPVFDVAIRWLRTNLPADVSSTRLVHGDFRNGNMIIGHEGVRAILDWEVAHFGDPAEDLAWICAPPWRFGELDRPAGGLGTRQELFEAYEAASGDPVDAARVHYWEVVSSLRWGVGCAEMLDWFNSGRDKTVERAMIARRVSESELDLMRTLTGRH